MYLIRGLFLLQLLLFCVSIPDTSKPYLKSNLDESHTNQYTNHLDSSRFNLNRDFILKHASDRSSHQDHSSALRYSSPFYGTSSSLVKNPNLFDESIAVYPKGRLGVHTAVAGKKGTRLSKRAGRADSTLLQNESRAYDSSLDRKSVANGLGYTRDSAGDDGSNRLGDAEGAKHRLTESAQLKQSDKLDALYRLADQLNQLNIPQQLDDADQINKLNNHPTDPHHSSNNLIRPTNNRNPVDLVRQLSRFKWQSVKHGKFTLVSRSRRSSAHNDGSNKRLEIKKEELLAITQQLEAELLAKNDLQGLKILSHLNNISTLPYLSENYTDYIDNSTNAYVELPPSLKVFFYCIYTLIFFVGLIGNSLVSFIPMINKFNNSQEVSPTHLRFYRVQNIYVVYSNKSMYNVTYFFITNLAMSDILLCLFSVPITPMYLLFYK